jgi:hypothetical protein
LVDPFVVAQPQIPKSMPAATNRLSENDDKLYPLAGEMIDGLAEHNE